MSQSPEETALIRAAAAAPDDDTPRMVYADWLDDHGRQDRAELIRLQCGIEAQQRKVDVLIRQHGREWAGRLIAAGADEWAFHRGFPEEVTFRFRDFLAAHPMLNDVTPLCRVRLLGHATDDPDADLAALARLPVAGQFRSLEFDGPSRYPTTPDYGVEGVRTLVTSPHLSGLRELALHSHHVGLDGVGAIADSPVLSNLTLLSVTDPSCRTDEQCLVRLARSPHLLNLDRVDFGDGRPASMRIIRGFAGGGPRSSPDVGR